MSNAESEIGLLEITIEIQANKIPGAEGVELVHRSRKTPDGNYTDILSVQLFTEA